MREHELKIWPPFFDEVEAGRKPFEVRFDDRGYEVGDRLRLREYEPGPHEYTGRSVLRQISYVLRAADIPFGAASLKPGFAVLGLAITGMED